MPGAVKPNAARLIFSRAAGGSRDVRAAGRSSRASAAPSAGARAARPPARPGCVRGPRCTASPSVSVIGSRGRARRSARLPGTRRSIRHRVCANAPAPADREQQRKAGQREPSSRGHPLPRELARRSRCRLRGSIPGPALQAPRDDAVRQRADGHRHAVHVLPIRELALQFRFEQRRSAAR